MRLLIVNANTSEAMTKRLAAEARSVAAPETEIRAVTGRFGVPFIECRSELIVAGHATLDAVACHHAGCDAAIVACFCDAGVSGAKELAPVPVVGMAEAAMHVAALTGGRFSIVTIGSRAAAMIGEMAVAYGFSTHLAGVRVAALAPADLAADEDRAVSVFCDLARAAMEEDGAESVILGGAAMAGMAGAVQKRVDVPVIAPLSSAVLLAEALVRLRLPKSTRNSFRAPPRKEVSGLSPELTAFLGASR